MRTDKDRSIGRFARVYGGAVSAAVLIGGLLGFVLDAPAWAAVGFGVVSGLISIGLDMAVMALDVATRSQTSTEVR